MSRYKPQPLYYFLIIDLYLLHSVARQNLAPDSNAGGTQGKKQMQMHIRESSVLLLMLLLMLLILLLLLLPLLLPLLLLQNKPPTGLFYFNFFPVIWAAKDL